MIDTDGIAELMVSYTNGFTEIYNGSIADWATRNVTLPIGYNPPGSFNVEHSRYMVKPLEALRNNNVREVRIMANTRGGKSLVGELFLLYTIANNPGNTLSLTDTADMGKRMGDSRMTNLLKLCPPVKKLILNDLHAITKQRYKFGNGMTVNLGSYTLSNLQSMGFTNIIADEIYLADKGIIGELKARVGDYPDTHKILLISQGGVIGDDWTKEFYNGSVYEYGWTCPHCNKLQLFEWFKEREDGTYAGINWDRNAKINGQWNYKQAGQSAWLECFDCKNQLKDTVKNRELLNKTGDYIRTQDGDDSKLSFRWNALADRKVKWSKLVEEYLFAKDAIRLNSDETLKNIFINKRLAKSIGEDNTEKRTNVELNESTYDVNTTWKEEKTRVMAIDVQEISPKYWWLITALAESGESRAIKKGYTDSLDEVEKIQLEHGVKYNRVFIDSGNDTTTIYEDCVKRGKLVVHGQKQFWLSWNATKGHDKDDWTHKENGIDVIKHHSPQQTKAVNLTNNPKYKRVLGCPFYTFSNLHYKNLLNHLLNGKGAPWLVGNVSDDEFKKQMVSEHLVTESNGKKRWVKVKDSLRNEWWDLEVLTVFAASLINLVGVTPIIEQTT